MPKFTITTLGCKVNQAESDSIAQDLISTEWQPAGKSEPSDVCIVNTCAVTQKASMQSRQAVRQAIRSNPEARIVVTGCYAQTAAEELKKIEGIHVVVGQGQKHLICQMLRSEDEKKSETWRPLATERNELQHFESMPIATGVPRTRAFLKIQDGCDAFCTYCIVPYARGRSRSMSADEVMAGVRQLAAAGYHEVVLTGIQLGAYGHDLSPTTGLAALMELIGDLNPIDRVRLSSIEPLEFSDDIIRRVADREIFCRHFHIPLQSGDDGVLSKMGRPYSGRTFHDLIARIHRLVPEAAIGADILIGFPGESDAAFETTYKLIEDLPVSYLHVFPFSARKGTPAATFGGHIPTDIIKDRCERMRILGAEKRIAFYRRFIGRKMKILIETKNENGSGWLKGISSNYLPVFINADDNLKNKIVKIKIEKLEGNKLFGILRQ